MQIFVTDTDRHRFTGKTINSDLAAIIISKFLKEETAKDNYIGLDFETTGLDPLVSKPLLLAVGNKDIQYVIDCTTVNLRKIFTIPINFINHHVKFDLKYFMVHYRTIEFKNLYCTMVMEQKLFQNTSRSFSLEKTVLRYLGYVPANMIKSTRKEFVNANPATIIFTDSLIEYAAADVMCLHEVRNKQMAIATANGQMDWMLYVEFPLIEVLADIELTGFNLNIPALKEIIIANHEVKHNTAVLLDEELRNLRSSLLQGEEALTMTHGKYDRKRNKADLPVYEGLFGAISEYEYFSRMKSKVKTSKKTRSVKIDQNIGNINWSSADEILSLFAKLNQPAPLQGDAANKYGYLIPVITNDKYGKRKLDKSKGIDTDGKVVSVPKYNEKKQGYTVGKKAFIKYFIDFPNTPIRKLISLLNEYTRASHEISSFGENFINNINPNTGRIHTTYRQCEAVNGRLQSGGGKSKEKDKINFQNIPRSKKFRELFYGTKGHSVVTCDLTGAEVTFMCDMANDELLYEWAVVNDDSHSPMVQNVWRTIFEYRAGLAAKQWKNAYDFQKKRSKFNINSLATHSNSEVVKWLTLSKTFEVNKKTNTAYRTAGKNGTFGGIYGMKAKKAQETFNGTDIELSKENPNFTPVNVTLEEGKVILYAQKLSIPKTFAMVEANVQKGLRDGYIILNDRSYSRIWFEEVINLKKFIHSEYGDKINVTYVGNSEYRITEEGTDIYMGTEELNWEAVKDADGQSRNVPISGTQADCVKEAMVLIHKAIKSHNLADRCKILSQVHDELVCDCPKYLDGKSPEWLENRKTTQNAFCYKADWDDDLHKIAKDGGDHVIAEPYQLGDNHYLDVSFPYFVKLTLIKAANRFLKNVKMQASVETKDTWTK